MQLVVRFSGGLVVEYFEFSMVTHDFVIVHKMKRESVCCQKGGIKVRGHVVFSFRYDNKAMTVDMLMY